MAYPNIQSAIKLFEKLVQTKLENAPMPKNENRVFPVAALPNGRLLLSTGEIRQTPIMNKIAEMNEKKAFEGKGQNPSEYVSNLSLNIAVPANKTGTELGSRATAFVNYVNSVLNPKLSAPAETGLPALVPELAKESQVAFAAPSALANLPDLAPAPEKVQTENFFQNFNKESGNFIEALKKDFAKITGGEQEAGSIRRFANLPLVQGYGTAYRLPSQANAQYAQISGNPFALTDRIR